MALHTDLPIYKAAYDLLDVVTDLAKNMPRDFKASIGGTLRDECVKVTILIFRANVATDKSPHLTGLLERTEVLNLILRLACDKRMISKQQYAKAIFLTGSIGKQANGWRTAATRLSHRGQGRHD